MNTINLALKKNFGSGYNLKMALKNIAVGLGAGSVLVISMFLALFGMGGQGGLLASLSGSSAGTAKVTIIKDAIPDNGNVSFQFVNSKNSSQLNLEDDGTGSSNSGIFNFSNVTPSGEQIFIQEVNIPTGYVPSFECNDIDNTKGVGPKAFLNIKEDDDITCKFTNIKLGDGVGSIKIIKDAGGNDGTDFKFTLTSQIEQPRDFTLDDDGTNDNTYENNETFNVSNFPNELEYTVTETSSSDEYFVSYECFAYKSNDRNTKLREWSGLGNVNKFKMYDINALYNVECIFKNTHTDSSITVKKDLQPDDNAREFKFKITEGSQLQVPEFKITEPDPKKVALLPNKTYVVKEILTDQEIINGTYDVSYECLSGSTVVASGAGTETTDLPLGDNENIICTFTNVDHSNSTTSITIQKVTDPTPNTTDEFKFVIEKPNHTISGEATLKDGESQIFPNADFTVLEPGTYNITETDGRGPNGEKYFTSYKCTSDKAGFPTTEADGYEIENLVLRKYENITCVFTNTRNSEIKITKKTQPDPDIADTVFNFEVLEKKTNTNTQIATGSLKNKQSFSVFPGNGVAKNYIIEEKNIPVGYTLNDITCKSENTTITRQPSDTKNYLIITLNPHEVFECTFTNVKPTRITVKKNTSGDLNKRFPFLISSGSGAPLTPVFELNHAGTSQSYPVPGNSFIVEETNTFNYVAGYSCVDGAGTVIKKSPNDGLNHPKAEFTVPNYSSVTCTFTNIREDLIPTIRVTKKVIPSENAIFNFKIESNDNGYQIPDFQLGDGSTMEFKVGKGFTYIINEFFGFNQDPYITTYICTSNKRDTFYGSSTIATITPPIQEGEHIVCKFVNCKEGGGTLCPSLQGQNQTN